MLKMDNTTFKGDVLRLLSGTGIAQVIALAATPLLTRLFSPDAFGIAAIFAATSGIIGSIACFRFEQAILLPESDREAINVLNLCLLATLAVSISTVLIAAILSSEKLGIDDVLPIGNYVWLLPLSVLLTGTYTAFQFWNTRTKHFSRISMATVAGSASSNGVSLSFGFFGHSIGGSLIVAGVCGQIISSSLLIGMIIKKDLSLIINSFSMNEITLLMSRYKKFPIYGSWSILLGTGAWMLPLILMGFLFSPHFVGLYALGFRILQIPTSLLGSAISQVFLQESVQARKGNYLPEALTDLFTKLVALSLLPFLLLSVVGQDIYEVVFGSEWREAGLYTQILAPWAFLWFLSSPLTSLFSVLEEQKLQLKWNIVNFILRVSAVLIGAYVDSLLISVILLGVFGVIIYGYKIVLTFRIANACLSKPTNVLFKYFFYSFMPVVVVICLIKSNASMYLSVSVATLFVMFNMLWFGRKLIGMKQYR